jgi:hypothetical protein
LEERPELEEVAAAMAAAVLTPRTISATAVARQVSKRLKNNLKKKKSNLYQN